MFGSDRGHGKYVSVCDILCIVGKLLERLLEDAAPCLTLPHTYTSVLSFPRDGGHTETNMIYMASSDVSHSTALFWI